MNQRGAVIAAVAGLMFVFMAMSMLALDLGHLYIIRNELQNAADAGALAGVRFLYNPDGSINLNANIIAMDAAKANKSAKLPVEVIETEVQRGHWSFSTGFTANDSLEGLSISDIMAIAGPPPYSVSDLDVVNEFVNSIRVVARRGGTPGGTQAKPFFAGLWGYLGFNLAATATAYIGFSQAIEPDTIDKPIAICLQAVMEGNQFSCVTGRMINSSGSGTDTNVGAWTNYSQDPECNSTSANELKDILSGCEGSNTRYVFPTLGISVMNGGLGSETSNSAWGNFMDCWKHAKYDPTGSGTPDTPIPLDSRGYPTKSWRIKLPLIDCKDFKSIADSNCKDFPVMGTIDMDVVWIVGKSDPHYDRIPFQMDDWSCTDTSTEASRQACWDSFANHFNLRSHDQTGNLTPYAGVSSGGPMSIYVKPTCSQHIGTTSGPLLFSFFPHNPVLVK